MGCLKVILRLLTLRLSDDMAFSIKNFLVDSEVKSENPFFLLNLFIILVWKMLFNLTSTAEHII